MVNPKPTISEKSRPPASAISPNVSRALGKLQMLYTKQYAKVENVSVTTDKNIMTIDGLTEDQLLNFKLFSNRVFKKMGVGCYISSASYSIGSKKHVYNSLRYLLQYAIAKNNNKTTLNVYKPFSGNLFGMYTKNIHQAIDIITDLSPVVPTSLNYQKIYKAQLSYMTN